MIFIQTEIPDVVLVKPTLIEDDRGFFMESYQIESSSLSDEIKELEEKGYDVPSLNTSIESINR